jgi:hypothetical protein
MDLPKERRRVKRAAMHPFFRKLLVAVPATTAPSALGVTHVWGDVT